jgi:hypothetical protein
MADPEGNEDAWFTLTKPLFQPGALVIGATTRVPSVLGTKRSARARTVSPVIYEST